MELSELQKIHDTLISVAHRAGALIIAAKPTTDSAGSKKNSVDLVTETDRAVEAFISSSLSSTFPDVAFIGEETYVPGQTSLTDAPTFICDPIDGTTNFVHGYPYVSISLGLCVGRAPVVGVVYNPFIGQTYSAIKGQGAFRTTHFPGQPGQQPEKKERLPIRDPAPLDGLKSALLCIEWGSDRSGNDMRVKIDTFAALARANEEGGAMAHSLRSFGSAALNLCGVAEGGLDCYWEAGCWAWDVCAGWCILVEAGGCAVDANPGGWGIGLESRRFMFVRGDGQQKSLQVHARKGMGGMKLSSGQKDFVDEFWSFVKGKFELGPPQLESSIA